MQQQDFSAVSQGQYMINFISPLLQENNLNICLIHTKTLKSARALVFYLLSPPTNMIMFISW